MLSTIMYSINPTTNQKMDGFVSFSGSDANAIKRRDQLKRDIESGSWQKWNGGNRKKLVEVAQKNGYDIKISLCLIEE